MNDKIIIVPAFNEERSLPSALRDLQKYCPEFDVVVINDASKDNTEAVAQRFGVTVLSLPVNLGIGGAIQTGLRWASKNHYSVAIQFDGDGQHQARYIKDIVRPILDGASDLVVGSRYLNDRNDFETTLVRRNGMRVFTFLFRLMSGTSIIDTTSGFRAYGKKAIALYLEHYPFDFPEMPALIMAKRTGLRITEVPVEMSPRRFGQSSIGFWKSAKAIAAGFAALLREKRSFT